MAQRTLELLSRLRRGVPMNSRRPGALSCHRDPDKIKTETQSRSRLIDSTCASSGRPLQYENNCLSTARHHDVAVFRLISRRGGPKRHRRAQRKIIEPKAVLVPRVARARLTARPPQTGPRDNLDHSPTNTPHALAEHLPP